MEYSLNHSVKKGGKPYEDHNAAKIYAFCIRCCIRYGMQL